MCQAFSRLMQELISTERELIVVATKLQEMWSTTQDLPTGNTFNKAFNVKQETQNYKPRVVMYCILKSNWRWKDLKGNNGVFRYIKQRSIFIWIDQIDTKETGIVRFVLKLHTTLVRKEELVQEPKIGLAKNKVEGDKTVDK
eukprot:8297659-Ditylum_brightwellii.AAC.1